MMLKIIILTFFLIKFTNSLKSSDICSLFTEPCRLNIFSFSKFTCPKKPYCAGKLNHSCGNYYCSETKSKCTLFLKLSKSNHLVQSIKKCIFDWNPKDACLNKNKCRYIRKLPLRFGGLGVLKIGKCPCNLANLSYDCKNSYCARDKVICKAIEKSTNIQKKNSVKNCRNSNDTIVLL